MKGLFNRTFFKFVSFFVAIIAISFFVIFITGVFDARTVENVEATLVE